jgi:hypothetical protein
LCIFFRPAGRKKLHKIGKRKPYMYHTREQA